MGLGPFGDNGRAIGQGKLPDCIQHGIFHGILSSASSMPLILRGKMFQLIIEWVRPI